MPSKLNFKIHQGSTFREVLRWESGKRIYKQISNVAKTAPVEISTVLAHEIPDGWRVKITNVVGMKEINSTELYHTVSTVLPGSFQLNNINAIGYSNYTEGGTVEYYEPVDLTGVTARMQIREKLDSDTVILELTTENSGIIIDQVNKTITIHITAVQTAALTFSTAVYGLELVKSGDVIPFITGSISLIREVTR